MVSMITKRDGRIVPYDETRIRMAIELAMTDNNTNGMDRKDIVDTIVNNINNKLSTVQDSEIDVELIQNYIVQIMKDLKLPKLAKNYTSYRNKRTRIREKKSSLMKSIGEMNNATAISSNSKRENANIDGDTAMGTMLKFGTTTSKEYYLNSVLPEEMSKAHREGYIHIHDLDFFSLQQRAVKYL
jgi:ribonucleoside-triphosphate reductase